MTLEEYLKESGHTIARDDAIDLAEMVINYIIEQTVENEPYATTTLNHLRAVQFTLTAFAEYGGVQ